MNNNEKSHKELRSNQQLNRWDTKEEDTIKAQIANEEDYQEDPDNDEDEWDDEDE